MPIHQIATASITIIVVKALWAGASGVWAMYSIYDALGAKYKFAAWKISAAALCTAIAWAM